MGDTDTSPCSADHVADLKSLLVDGRLRHPPARRSDFFQPLLTLVLLRRQRLPGSAPTIQARQLLSEQQFLQLLESGTESVELQQKRDIILRCAVPKLLQAALHEEMELGDVASAADAAQPCLFRSGSAHRRKRERDGESVELPLRTGMGDSTVVEDWPFRLLVELLSEAGAVYLPPFVSDAAFLHGKEFFLAVQYKSVLMEPLLSSLDIKTLEHHQLEVTRHVLPAVQGFVAVLQAHVESQTQRMNRPPRVLRLAERLELSPRESSALVYLAVAQSGTCLPLLIDRIFCPASVALWNGLNPTELHHFLRDDRSHIHQGLVVVSEVTSFPESKVMLPQEAAAVLSGVETTHDQMAKLEKTVLGEVLAEEEEHTAVSRASEPNDASDETESEPDRHDEETEEHSSDAARTGPLGPPHQQLQRKGGAVPALVQQNMDVPYHNNFECMEAAFYLISLMIKIRNMEGDIKEEEEQGKRKKDEAVIRGMEGKLRVAQDVHNSRVRATLASGTFVPAIESLSARFQLSELEKNILLLLVGNSISHDVLVAVNGRYFMREGQRFITVGYIIFVLCKGLQQRVEARQAFYRSSRLISNSIISLSADPMGNTTRSCFNTDLMEYTCEIDRKIVDLLMGRETESQEMVPGSSVIVPSVSLDKVVLPRAVMDRVLSRVEHFNLVDECKKQSGFGVGLGDSSGGLVILFYGPSGTGKTMLAHAVAKELRKALLLVNVSAFKGVVSAPDMMRFLFREAKLRDAIIFFDECECLFATRTENTMLTTLLVEFEKYDGLILMATNAAQCFDESMNRRIALMIEFKPPDHSMRHQIWLSHIPTGLCLAEDVSLERLALNYELTGGLIRNAVLAAISSAVAREKSAQPTLRMEDFDIGAKQQLRGFFMATADVANKAHYVTPRRRLEELVMEHETKSTIENVAKLAKSRSTLFSLWGFNEENAPDQGLIYLFHGPSGTGKSLAAEGIAYECGLTIRVCNAPSLLCCDATSSGHIANVFEEAQKLGSMVVIEESQYFFQHGVEESVMSIIVYHALRHSKPVILIATTDPRFSVDFTRHTHAIPLALTISFSLPRRKERAELWNRAFPTGVPLAKDIDVEALSESPLSAKQIERTAFRVCCKAALMPADARVVSMKMVSDEVAQEVRAEQARRSMMSMYA